MASLAAGCNDSPSGDSEVGGKADEDEGPKVELKLTIDPLEIRQARNQLELRNEDAQERGIWFFDTAGLELFESGAILRVRQIDEEADDATIKLRPRAADTVDPSWFELAGFKCELDRSTDRETSSCSLTVDDESLSEAAAAAANGKIGVDELFTDEQELWLAEGDRTDVEWSDVIPLGPIPAQVWTIKPDRLPAKLTAELWSMPDGSEMLELSLKVPVADGEDALADLLEFVADRELALDPDQESKTRRALELLSPAGV